MAKNSKRRGTRRVPQAADLDANIWGNRSRDGFSFRGGGIAEDLYRHLYETVPAGLRRAEMLRLMIIGFKTEYGLEADDDITVPHPLAIEYETGDYRLSFCQPKTNEDRPQSVQEKRKLAARAPKPARQIDTKSGSRDNGPITTVLGEQISTAAAPASNDSGIDDDNGASVAENAGTITVNTETKPRKLAFVKGGFAAFKG